MKMKLWRQRLCFCLTVILLLLPATVHAGEIIDTEKQASLTIQYPCKDARFQLYQVADVSENGTYTLTGDFTSYPVSLKQEDQSGWRGLAVTLSAYAARDKVAPLTAGNTDANGRLIFSDLRPGLYLVTGQRRTSGKYIYTPEPCIVSLPSANAEDEWLYDVTAQAKYSRKPDRPDRPDEPDRPGKSDNGDITRKVLKVWEDGDNEEERPDSIEVELLRDGQVWDTVTLHPGNNWRYSWSKLSDQYDWQVVEKEVPEGYFVSIEQEGITFVMTNTSDTIILEEPVALAEYLPQTGQLWWPVPILACCGMAMFLIGWIRYRREEHDA